MFEGFCEKTVDFMWGIRLNNNREWFTEHKEEYKDYFETPMKVLANGVYAEFSKEFPEFGLILRVSRIYLDTRRPRPFGPYRDHLWFSIRTNEEEWTDKPTFWFEIGPEMWTCGLGYYTAKASTMRKFRARIDKDPTAMIKLNGMLNSQIEFRLSGESYRRAKGKPGNGLDEWYNMKNYSIMHSEQLGRVIMSRELTERLISGFRFLAPFYDYLSTVDSDPDPEDNNS